jgi:hypothetical protein
MGFSFASTKQRNPRGKCSRCRDPAGRSVHSVEEGQQQPQQPNQQEQASRYCENEISGHARQRGREMLVLRRDKKLGSLALGDARLSCGRFRDNGDRMAQMSRRSERLSES